MLMAKTVMAVAMTPYFPAAPYKALYTHDNRREPKTHLNVSFHTLVSPLFLVLYYCNGLRIFYQLSNC